MCVNPILIPNPNYRGNLGRYAKSPYRCLSDTASRYIPISCGHCYECVAKKQSFLVQRTQMEALDNYLYFVTLTYNSQSIMVLDVNGYKHQYAPYSDIQNMFKRFRVHNPDFPKFRYLVCSEYGGDYHRPHWHMIISVPKSESDTKSTKYEYEHILRVNILNEWSRNVGSDKKPIYKPLCTYIRSKKGYTYDCHLITTRYTKKGRSTELDVAYYVSKYVTKFDPWIEKKRSALKLNLSPRAYSDVWRLIGPRCHMSKGYGNPKSAKVAAHIRKGIEYSLESIDVKTGYNNQIYYFISPADGSYFPLSSYYLSKYLTLEDRISMYYRNNNPETCYYSDSPVFSTNKSADEIKAGFLKYHHRCSAILARNSSSSDEQVNFDKLSERNYLYIDIDDSNLTCNVAFDNEASFSDLPDFIPESPVDKLIGIEDTRTPLGFERYWLRRPSERYPFGISRFRPVYSLRPSYGFRKNFLKNIEKSLDK